MKTFYHFFFVTLMLLFLCYSCFMTGYTYHKDVSAETQDPDLQNVLDWNTKQIHSIGVAARIQSYNSDLLIQILNSLDGRPVKSISRDIGLETTIMQIGNNDPIENDDLEPTLEQIEKDQREIDQSIRALASGGLYQGETLHTILDKLGDDEASIAKN